MGNGTKPLKQKLLLVVPMLHQGGFERVCVRTARIMEPWFDVTIAMFSDADIAYDITGLSVVNLDVPAAEGKLQKIMNVGKRIGRMRALKKKLKPHITYSFGPTANLINVLTPVCGKIWTGVRSYMDMDNPGKLKLFCRRSDKVICCSEVIAQELKERFGAENTEVLYNPYDCKMMEEMAAKDVPDMPDFSDKKMIISVGREDDVKEFWHLIKCMKLLSDRVPDARLCLVGEGSFEEYKKLAADLGVTDRICFAGLQKNPFPWMKQAALFVGVSAMEGFPNALVETMACGAGAVFSNCMSGPAEILSDRFLEVVGKQEVLEEKYGILVPVMDDQKNLEAAVITEEEKRLADLLEQLLKNEKRLEQLAEAARQRAAQFSDEAYAKKILTIAG